MNNLIKSDELNNRLRYAMNVRNIKSIDLSSKTGIDKSQISHYLKGDYKAKQDTLYLMANALNVNPVWLMGYDVPMEKNAEDLLRKIGAVPLSDIEATPIPILRNHKGRIQLFGTRKYN